MTEGEGSVYERALEIAVEARTLARQAHARQDAIEATLALVQAAIGALQTAVAQLNVKVGLAATVGSLIGGGAVAVAISYIHH